MTGALFSPSGGLLWHGRALAQRALWAEFRELIEAWLRGWQPPARGLLLLGPSAGWCLPDSFLGRFEYIHAVDTDPLAPLLFKLRHGSWLRQRGTHLNWQKGDLFEQLDFLLQALPAHAVLFANVLGQRAFHREDSAATERELAGLQQRLAGRSWASFHDRLSGEWRAGVPPGRPFRSTTVVDALTLAQRVAHAGQWNDHLTTHVLPADCERRFIPWMIGRGRLHWIEAGCVQ